MKNTLFVLFTVFCLMACKSKSENTPSENEEALTTDRQAIKKIDMHAHFQYPRTYLPEFFDSWNMQATLVDVAHEDSTSIRRSWDKYLAHAQTAPEDFFLCTSLIGVGIDDPDFATEAIAQLRSEIASGAQMVKVWKNFGMVTKDASGNFIQIDDPRLQPIWDDLKAQGIPVMGHIAEPEQAWRPLDPNNPHYGYYKNNPQYHAYNHPEIPSYETIIAARDHWIENNPELPILCAHIGSMSHDVDMVATRLDKYPNMQVELAARFGDLARQDSRKVRTFFDTYQDRIMFGSDFGNGRPESEMTPAEIEDEKEDIMERYETLWRYLSSTDSLVVRGQKTEGLGLPAPILRKVYHDNAAKFLELN